MLRLKGRVIKLEMILTPAPGPMKGLRLVVATGFSHVNLANSTCDRTLSSYGTLKEIVVLDGSLHGEELERFIKSFPIRDAAY
jgi:hypothetical protein